MDEHRSADELTAALDDIRQSPASSGTVELIVRRPAENEREVLDEGVLDLELGLVGDVWKDRGSSRTPDRSANPDAQLTVMNARAAHAIAGTRSVGRSRATSCTSTSTSASRTFPPAPASRSATPSSR